MGSSLVPLVGSFRRSPCLAESLACGVSALLLVRQVWQHDLLPRLIAGLCDAAMPELILIGGSPNSGDRRLRSLVAG